MESHPSSSNTGASPSPSSAAQYESEPEPQRSPLRMLCECQYIDMDPQRAAQHFKRCLLVRARGTGADTSVSPRKVYEATAAAAARLRGGAQPKPASPQKQGANGEDDIDMDENDENRDPALAAVDSENSVPEPAAAVEREASPDPVLDPSIVPVGKEWTLYLAFHSPRRASGNSKGKSKSKSAPGSEKSKSKSNGEKATVKAPGQCLLLVPQVQPRPQSQTKSESTKEAGSENEPESTDENAAPAADNAADADGPAPPAALRAYVHRPNTSFEHTLVLEEVPPRVHYLECVVRLPWARRALCVDRAGLEGLLKGVKTENSKLFKNETWLKGAIDMLASHRLIEPLSGDAVVRAGLKASMRLRRIWSQDTDEWPPLPPRNESVHTFNFNDAKREAEPWVSELGPLPKDDA